MRRDNSTFFAEGCMYTPWTNDKLFFLVVDFDCPNIGFYSKEKDPLPFPCMVQLSAFAREIRTFESEEAYYESQKKESEGPYLSSQFFGTGANVDTDDKGRKLPTAVIVGHVIETELKTNEITGKQYYWALIETSLGVEIDVVIHPTLLASYGVEAPQVGGVIRGYFFLSGLLLL